MRSSPRNGFPNAPERSSSEAALTCGKLRYCWDTASLTPAAAQAATIRRACSRVSAIGFSTSACVPAAAQASTMSSRSWVEEVHTVTKSRRSVSSMARKSA